MLQHPLFFVDHGGGIPIGFSVFSGYLDLVVRAVWNVADSPSSVYCSPVMSEMTCRVSSSDSWRTWNDRRMVRSTEASVPDRNVEPAFEVGDDVFERHVEEGQVGLYPAVVVRGVHLFDDHGFRWSR